MIHRIPRLASALLLMTVALSADAQTTKDAQQTKEAKPAGSISGTIVNSVDGSPIKGANVHLHGPQKEKPEAYTDIERHSTRSAANGTFLVDGLSAGRYSVFVSKPGYVGVQTKTSRRPTHGVALSLGAGESLTGEVLELVPSSAISGKIVDEEGEPVMGVQVDARKWTFSEGRRTLQSVGGGRSFGDSMTNDRGEYRLFGLLPGRYYLVVKPMWDSLSSEGRLVKTYYPNSRHIAEATPIVLGPGEEVRADFSLVHLPGVKVKGTLTGAAVEAKQPGEFLIQFRSEENSSPIMTGSKSDGTFELESITPGSYEVLVSAVDYSEERTGPKEVARANVEVPAGGIDNLRIGVVPPAIGKGELQGVVVSADDDFKPGGWFILLVQSDPASEEDEQMNTTGFASARPDGTFKMNAPEPGEYYLRAHQRGFGPWDKWYVSSIDFNGRDVTNRPLTLPSNATGTLRITMSSRSAALDGAVTDAQGKPAPQAQIMLFPTDGNKRPDLYKTAQSDQNGRFKIRGIVPGSYNVIALSDLDSDAAADPNFVKTIGSRGTSVRLEAGTPQTIALKVTTDFSQQ